MSQKEEFIKAIENDEYCEWELGEGVYLITDHEFDGTFFPNIIEMKERHTEEEIDNLLEEAGASDVFEWEDIEYDTNNECYYPIVTKCKYETVDHTVWD